jgi:hypothetical protein
MLFALILDGTRSGRSPYPAKRFTRPDGAQATRLPSVRGHNNRICRKVRGQQAMIEFKGSHFEQDVILWAVHCYAAYTINYR